MNHPDYYRASSVRRLARPYCRPVDASVDTGWQQNTSITHQRFVAAFQHSASRSWLCLVRRGADMPASENTTPPTWAALNRELLESVAEHLCQRERCALPRRCTVDGCTAAADTIGRQAVILNTSLFVPPVCAKGCTSCLYAVTGVTCYAHLLGSGNVWSLTCARLQRTAISSRRSSTSPRAPGCAAECSAGVVRLFVECCG